LVDRREQYVRAGAAALRYWSRSRQYAEVLAHLTRRALSDLGPSLGS
jgi:uncharacterized protein YjiS (DUF1127 family)